MKHRKITIETFPAKKSKKEHDLSAVDLQPSTDKDGSQNDKIYVRK